MSGFFRFGLAVNLSVVLLAAPAALAADTPLVARDGVWAQTYSDLKADPDVRFGQLPNGMRYAIMHNATPPHQVSIRLRVGTGSVEETDAQQGLAHFLEHMAFKGSAKVPEGEMIKMLQRLGLAFGADTNASTSWDQTVYMLDLPEADANSIDTGLMLTRETASELTLDQGAMDHERGVILSEERLRDTPDYRADKAQFEFLLAGQRVPARFPIGKVDIIKAAPVARIAEYYRANYRPERTTLVVAGDVDIDAIETKVKNLFSSWAVAAPAPPKPDLGHPETRGSQVRLAVEPGAQPGIEIAWANPYDDGADTAAKRRRDTIRRVALAVLNRRLEHAAQAPQPPFLRASASRANVLKSADVTSFSISSAPDDWRKALLAADALRRQAVESGVRQDEVDREITEGRTARQNAVAGAATRRSPQLASALVGSAASNTVFTTPAQSLALFEDAVKGLTATEVSTVLRDLFQGQGPLVFMAAPKPVEGGETALAEAFRQAEAAPVATAAAEQTQAWPYDRGFGAVGHVVQRTEIADLGASFIRFANGVRLTVKPTKFTNDQVLVDVRIGDGFLELPRDRPTAKWAGSAFIQGGLKDLTFDDVERIFAAKVASASFGVGEEAFALAGQTRGADLDAQLQLLAAYATAPGFRPEAFERARTQFQTQLDQLNSTPGGVLGRDLPGLTHSGDFRWRLPDRAELAAAKPADLPELLQKPLSRGNIEIVIVGDIDVDRAATAVAATFGALPKRPDSSPPARRPREIRFPGPALAPVALTHKGRGDQAIAVVAWRTDDFFADPQRARATRLAEQILHMRLIDQFRIAEGNTYSPATDFVASQVFPHYGYVSARVETPPAKIAQFYSEAAKIAADMRSQGVTEDELQRARLPRIEALQKSQQTNQYWVSALGGAQTDPRKIEAIRMTIPGLEKVTADDVKAAAALYLTDDRAWKATVLPEARRDENVVPTP